MFDPLVKLLFANDEDVIRNVLLALRLILPASGTTRQTEISKLSLDTFFFLRLELIRVRNLFSLARSFEVPRHPAFPRLAVSAYPWRRQSHSLRSVFHDPDRLRIHQCMQGGD